MGDNREKVSSCVDAHFHGSAHDGTISLSETGYRFLPFWHEKGKI